jgi:hypothetical protein
MNEKVDPKIYAGEGGSSKHLVQIAHANFRVEETNLL